MYLRLMSRWHERKKLDENVKQTTKTSDMVDVILSPPPPAPPYFALSLARVRPEFICCTLVFVSANSDWLKRYVLLGPVI